MGTFVAKNKKIVFNIIFLFLVFGITIYCVFKGQNLEELCSYLVGLDWRYYFLGIVCVIVFIGSESVIIFYMMRTINQKIKLNHCFLYSFVGFFFSCITPSATGGQPAQLYFMNKDKLPISVSTLVLMIVTITYKMVLVVLGVAVFIIKPKTVMPYLLPVINWCYLGVALNVFCVGAMMVLVFHPSLARNLLLMGIRLLGRFGIVKRLENRLERVENSMKQYEEVALYFGTHKRVIINVLIITFFQRLLLFFVTALVYYAFGFKGIDVVTITLLQGMISVSVDMLPLPGGMGISEQLFLSIFAPIFGKLTLPAMIVSRGLSYYTQLLISAIMTIVAYFTMGRVKKRRREE